MTTRFGPPVRSIRSFPCWRFRRGDGKFECILFNHSTHTIGTHKPGVRSPSFYGLAARSIEKDRGGTVIFFEGASGSTHNLDVATPEATHRIEDAVLQALDLARPRPSIAFDPLKKEVASRFADLTKPPMSGR